MKPCPEAIRPAGRTEAKGKEAVERKQFYQVEIAPVSCRRVLHFSTGSPRVRRENPNHLLALTRFGCGLSVNGLCWGFEARPRQYRRRRAIILRSRRRLLVPSPFQPTG